MLADVFIHSYGNIALMFSQMFHYFLWFNPSSREPMYVTLSPDFHNGSKQWQ